MRGNTTLDQLISDAEDHRDNGYDDGYYADRAERDYERTMWGAA